MDDRSIRVRLIAEIGSYVQGMKTAGAATADFGRNVSGMGTAGKADIEKVGKGAMLMAGGLAIGLGLAAKAAIDWESAWAGVTKTVDGTASEMADLEDGLRDLAKELPSTHAEIAAVAEAAGALGIQRGAIEGFTKTMIDLGETTDLTADQAATAMAQIANVMQTPQSQFERMGSTLVDLGNKGASTESEILTLAQRLAAAGKIAGLSEADVFAFASTLSSVGVEAEAGGTALSKVFTRIRDATIDGGEDLETFARVAGVTAEEFATAFRDDPAMAIESFITGLGRMNNAGQSTTDVFKDLELNDERLKRSLLSTAEAEGLLADQINIARDAWKENTALQTEAEKRYATTGAQLEMLRNQVVDLGIDLGAVLLPAIRLAADALGALVKGFSVMPDGLKIAGVGLLGITAGLSGIVGITGVLLPKIRTLRIALLEMGAAGKVLSASMPYLAAAAAAIALVSTAMGRNAQKAEEAEDRVKGYTDAIREAGSAKGGAELKLVELANEFDEVATAIDESGISVSDWAAALTGTDAGFEAFISQLEALGPEAFESIDGGLQQLVYTLRERTRPEFLAAAGDAETLGRVLDDTGGDAEGATPKIAGAAGAVDTLAVSAEDAAKAAEQLQKDMGDAFGAFTEGTDAYQAVIDASRAWAEATAADTKSTDDTWEDYYDGFSVNTAEFIAQLEEQVAAQAEWAANLATIAFRGRADVAVELEKLGPEGAQIVAQFAGMTDAEFQHAADLWIATVSDGGAATGIALQDELRIMAAIGGRGGTATWQSIAASLDLGVPVVQLIAGKYGIAVDSIPNNKTVTVWMDTSQAWQSLRDLRGGLGTVARDWVAHVRVGTSFHPWSGSEAGGLVRASGMPDPGPTDTVPMMLALGEGVVNVGGMGRLGVAGLDALNSGRSPGAMFHGGSTAGAGLQQSGGATTSVFAPTIKVYARSDDPEALARTVTDAVLVAARRGISRAA